MIALTIDDRSVSAREGATILDAACATAAQDGMVVETESAAAVANLLTNPALDPHAKIPSFKVCAVRVEKAD